MFISIPIAYYYDDNSIENEEIEINPSFIVTISRDPDNFPFCIVTDVYGDLWYVRLSIQQLRNKIKSFQKQNIISLYSKGGS
jgi:uncharacterized protein YlzI (FlbEa/FlbD family)